MNSKSEHYCDPPERIKMCLNCDKENCTNCFGSGNKRGQDMTTKTLESIRELSLTGMKDSDIAAAVGTTRERVAHYRRKMGMGRRTGPSKPKRYTVYDIKTTEYLTEGTARECAERLGIKPNTFRSCLCHFKQGQKTKYEIYEVED